MRIRSSFLLFVAVIGVIVLGLAWRVISTGYADRQSALSARGLAATQGELLRFVELIGIERGAYNAALHEEKTTDPKGEYLPKPAAVRATTIAPPPAPAP